MRIIGGRYRGRRLAGVPKEIRPTSDRLRETLYGVLGEAVTGSAWLDAFAGSGAVGIEALSRGAEFVIWNDNNPQALRLLHKNLEICGIEEGYEIFEKDVFVLLRTLQAPLLDFIFLDPPYRFGRFRKLLDRVSRVPSLHPRTTIILEIFKKLPLDFLPKDWIISRNLLQGDNRLIFFQPH